MSGDLWAFLWVILGSQTGRSKFGPWVYWEWRGGDHLHGDVGEVSPPSRGMLLGLESGMGRGTGRATGGGGGSKKEPGILLWPLPFGCRQHTQGEECGCYPTPHKTTRPKTKRQENAGSFQTKMWDRRGWRWWGVEKGETTKRMVNVYRLWVWRLLCLCMSVCLNHRFTTGTDTGAVKERPRWRAFQHKTQGHKEDEIHNNEINSNRQERKY